MNIHWMFIFTSRREWVLVYEDFVGLAIVNEVYGGEVGEGWAERSYLIIYMAEP